MSSTLTLSTPQSVVQCQNTTISWTGGVGELPSEELGLREEEETFQAADLLSAVLRRLCR